MRTWLSPRTGLYAGAGLIAGVAAWWLGPRVALGVGTGLAVALVLVGWERLRRQRSRRGRSARAGLATTEQLRAMEKRLNAARRRDFAQLEALTNLYSMLPAAHRMPASRLHWAAAPDLLLLLVSLVQQRRPATIVDLGSGATTAWMALALQSFGVDGRVVSVDHDPIYAERTRQRLRGLDLEAFVEVRHAPLADLELDGEQHRWYDCDILADVKSCDLLVVDGPPGRVRRGARYPALPVFADRMADHSDVVLDDYARPAEQEIVTQWLARFPGWTLHEIPLERGAAHLVRGGR